MTLLEYIENEILDAVAAEHIPANPDYRDYYEISNDKDYILSIIQSYIDNTNIKATNTIKKLLERAQADTTSNVIDDNIQWVLETRFYS